MVEPGFTQNLSGSLPTKCLNQWCSDLEIFILSHHYMVTAQYVQSTGEGRGGGRNDKWGFG